MYINNGGTWKKINGMYINVVAGGVGTWKKILNGYINVVAGGVGTWKSFFTTISNEPKIAEDVILTTSSSSMPATLTGTNYRWTNATTLTYVFQYYNVFQWLNGNGSNATGTITNPSVGSSNTKTYTPVIADFPSSSSTSTGQFRFVVTATNTNVSPSIEAISTSNTVSIQNVIDGKPVNQIAPSLTQTLRGNMSVTSGTWTNSPTQYRYQWYDIDNPTVKRNVLTFSTSDTFLGNIGSAYIVNVTAYNTGNNGTADSNVLDLPPVPAGGSVSLTGNSTPGSTITARTEATSWTESPTSFSVIITAANFPTIPVESSTRVAVSINSNECSYTIEASDATEFKVFRAFARATNLSGSSYTVQSSNVINATVPNATAPTTVNAYPGTNQVTVSWSGATNATKYRVWYNSSDTGNSVNPQSYFDAETNHPTVSTTLTNLSSGTPLYFWVSASNSNNSWTPYSSSPRATATPSAPASAPSGGTAFVNPSSGTAGSTTYTGSTSGWSGTAPITFSYSWQYYHPILDFWIQVATGTTFSPASNFNTEYQNAGTKLLVTASNSSGVPGYAETYFTVNSPVVVTVPSAPTSPNVSASGLVTWTRPATATYHEVEYWLASSSSGANAYGPLSSGQIGNVSSYQITYQTIGGIYRNYARARVRGGNTAGYGSYSAWYPSSTSYV